MSLEPYLFNIRTAAEYLGISERIMEAYIANGKFELVKLPNPEGDGMLRRRLITRDELQRFAVENARKA